MKHDIDSSFLIQAPVIRLGCVLGYYTHAGTPAAFLVLPHVQCAATVLDESWSTSSGASLRHSLDMFGNRLLTTTLLPGHNELRYEANLELFYATEPAVLQSCSDPALGIPFDVLRYTLPSRYCESDKLSGFAREKFGHIPRGFAQAQAICDWVRQNFEYRHGSGDATLSACEAMRRGHGVCRDFAHIVIALCRALDLPARYVAGYIPIMEGNEIDGDNDIGTDFHAYAEVYVNGTWHTFDARYNQPLKGRIKIAHGMDAVDAAFATFYGTVDVLQFKVWTRQSEPVGMRSDSVVNASRNNLVRKHIHL
ncbi:MAG: transglutaminase-like domain-containing protein [Burkholderiaceae bacterium]